MPFDGGNKSNAEENSAAKDDAYDAEAAVAYPADPTVSYDDTP